MKSYQLVLAPLYQPPYLKLLSIFSFGIIFYQPWKTLYQQFQDFSSLYIRNNQLFAIENND